METTDPERRGAHFFAQRYFYEALGPTVLRELHRVNPFYDAALIAGLPVIFVALALALAHLPLGVPWIVLFVAQGFVIQLFGFVAHELTHRQIGSPGFTQLLRVIMMTPVYRSATLFKFWHLRHHKYTGGESDAEQYRVAIDTSRRRIAYATIVGLLFPRLTRRPGADQREQPNMRHLKAAVRLEFKVMAAFTLAWMGFAWFHPTEVLLGFVLPLIVVTPIASTMRLVLEHSDFDGSNPFQLGCFYRTNFLTRMIFLWDCGDCHMAHHVFPRMPFYRMSRALSLMRPGFLAHGVLEHRSILAVTWRWFADKRPYLSPPRG